MARISGANIPLNKRVEIGLTYIYGIGRSTSNELLAKVGVEPDRKVRDLTEDEAVQLRELIDGATSRSRRTCAGRAVAGDQAPAGDRIATAGLRHRRGLPVRGQNTKTNARTRKGPKRMQVAGKKKAAKK